MLTLRFLTLGLILTNDVIVLVMVMRSRGGNGSGQRRLLLRQLLRQLRLQRGVHVDEAGVALLLGVSRWLTSRLFVRRRQLLICTRKY